MKRKHPLIATNSLENLSPFSNQTPQPPPFGRGRGGHYTLITPLTPFQGGCKPCVYRHSDTLTPLNKNFRSYAREADMIFRENMGRIAAAHVVTIIVPKNVIV